MIGTPGTGVYRCCDDERRDLVSAQSLLNGIDYLEVVDHDEPVLEKRQRFLRIHFVNAPPPQPPLSATLKDIVRIDGGERIRNIVVKNAVYDGDVLVVEVVARGDFSPYTLRLVNPGTLITLDHIDPPLSSVEFSFKVECGTDFDCRSVTNCPPESEPLTPIDYLARDYGTFRRLMIDRISLLVPGWRERTAADLGVTLVELLAYVADHLSYQQDAIATEAYLGTARLRTSVRRHVRLVDYLLRDGCNARVFVHVNVDATVTLLAHTQFLTRLDGIGSRIDPGQPQIEALARGPLVFESMVKTKLHPDQNSLSFYTWGSENCCLPAGATAATLDGHPALNPDNPFILFIEVLGPRTGNASDADRAHRHVVRFTSFEQTVDALTGAPITEITWSKADALPFALCISAKIFDEEGHPKNLSGVSTALGNLVIADHGQSAGESLGTVPDPSLFRPPADGGDFCEPGGNVAVLPRFNPRLHMAPLTHVAPLDTTSARSVLNWKIDDVLPSIALFSPEGTGMRDWTVRRDLLESEPDDAHFVADVEEDGLATIRFGDGDYGLRPISGTPFSAEYRVGNGVAGNVGPDSLTHIVTSDTNVSFAWNPIGAGGGIEPETIEHARRSAPEAFRVQERAVTEADYAEVTERNPDVDRAAATFLWTGSWYTVFDSVDRPGGLEVDDEFRGEILNHIEKYRVVGKDAEVRSPLFVSLEIELTVCVITGQFRAEVESELRDLFTSGTRRDGTSGFFHPDNFTFGQPVVLSRIVASAAGIEGVDAVVVNRFRRQGQPRTDASDTGILSLGRLEIARLENNPNFPEHGSLKLTMRGGV
ncbi:MAG TPA: putative baseplate assembly protein [Thermoanaerobaculia bacterium]|jgi:hypothetical protein|nr:putative baseplate assembly protein [Thermoanaerobaculia bacterium]